jgi:hypothetical protein
MHDDRVICVNRSPQLAHYDRVLAIELVAMKMKKMMIAMVVLVIDPTVNWLLK